MPKAKKRSKYKDKYRFEIVCNPKLKQKFHWRARSCNGQLVCHSEKMMRELSPIKTINSFISAIKKGQYRIEEDLFVK